MKNYYKILNINRNASDENIKRAFRILAIRYHPDKNLGDNTFTEKFIAVKEAYDILSNSSTKVEYDKGYDIVYGKEKNTDSSANNYQEDKNEPQQKYTNKEKENKTTQRYKETQPFFTQYEREKQETLEEKPSINHWREPIEDDLEFFQFPKNIGRIISGYTTLKKDINPTTDKQQIGCYAQAIFISLLVSLGIIYFLDVQEDPFLIVLWIILPLLAAVYFAKEGVKFEHFCSYIGVNGFAIYKCTDERSNITKNIEINFNDVTDLIKITQVNKKNFNYSHTDFAFVWIKNEKEIYAEENQYFDEKGNPQRNNTEYWINTFAEKYWTVYLLDKMEHDLEKKGYIEFNLFVFENNKPIKTPYIHLSIGSIKFLTPKGNVVYNFDDIKKVYTKGTTLYIEHKNYEKFLFFFESGDKNGIPLLNLGNREFFFKALDLLLGYKF